MVCPQGDPVLAAPREGTPRPPGRAPAAPESPGTPGPSRPPHLSTPPVPPHPELPRRPGRRASAPGLNAPRRTRCGLLIGRFERPRRPVLPGVCSRSHRRGARRACALLPRSSLARGPPRACGEPGAWAEFPRARVVSPQALHQNSYTLQGTWF